MITIEHKPDLRAVELLHRQWGMVSMSIATMIVEEMHVLQPSFENRDQRSYYGEITAADETNTVDAVRVPFQMVISANQPNAAAIAVPWDQIDTFSDMLGHLVPTIVANPMRH